MLRMCSHLIKILLLFRFIQQLDKNKKGKRSHDLALKKLEDQRREINQIEINNYLKKAIQQVFISHQEISAEIKEKIKTELFQRF